MKFSWGTLLSTIEIFHNKIENRDDFLPDVGKAAVLGSSGP